MTDCKIIRKNDPIGSFELSLPHGKKDHKKFTDEFECSISYIDYIDYKPDQEEYETTELKVDKSKVKIDYKEKKGKMFVVLKSADISLKIDDEEMENRFTDKEWPEEWVEPTLHFKSKKKEFSLKYEDNSLFTLELI